MKKLTLQEFEDRLKLAHPQENLKALNFNTFAKECEVQCLTCGSIYIKKGGSFLDKRKKSICKICFPTQEGTFKKDYIPPKGYELVEPYQGAHTKILVKHICGFIWKIKPGNLNQGKGCPKCSKKMSKGEKKIIAFLEENNIDYIFQYPIKIQEHNFTIDFYLPLLDLYIEYNGEQHYKPVAYFGGEEKFQQQIYNDELKKQFLKEKLLIISYLEFDEISNILKSSTTIS